MADPLHEAERFLVQLLSGFSDCNLGVGNGNREDRKHCAVCAERRELTTQAIERIRAFDGRYTAQKPNKQQPLRNDIGRITGKEVFLNDFTI